ncbi:MULTISPECIES: hypothetical protein [unclassified Enterococcus]|uniref:hypothetical protein n=1 Tax=unclassified Enterococcus TaxID=2608891 RepID=UPI00155588B7|nr:MULTISPECIES: hypothetical protein [unclassified Enterococcus]MBS7577591.1 hypothetical protein [Enterococcus sp. MMGLQ5-2]MBS7584910.1 hypothetical protein [Enterococcus sp. MMGLQ5-1]NPD12765.1 hypothetical protein [Enterococcus sp. MMGLQ5-1]NPD37424.1 hypothetical protein [Enterococcus sp. MMGLQ5-2]
MKKRIILAVSLFSLMLVGTACSGGNGKKESEENQEGQKLTSKDVVSQKNDVLDGEEVTIYEMKDGSNIVLPRGVNMDDVDAVVPEEENIKSDSLEDSKTDD